MSWALHRIDDRLIHGQVLIAWGARFDPARIWVVDDGVAASDWEKQLFQDAAPGIEVHVATVAEAAVAYVSEAAATGNAFLLVRDLATACRLLDAGAKAHDWNVGGLHYAPGKNKVNDYVYLSDTDRADARALIRRGATLTVQDVPASEPTPLAKLDPALAA